MDFRQRAREALNRAKVELEASTDDRLRYAALELRLALEAITYNRLWLYREDIPPTEYSTWQPKRVMQLLLDIDPYADQSVTLHIGKEKQYGVPSDDMQIVGTENVLSTRTLKKHYDALGSYLHTPTLKQLENADIDESLKNLRKRCLDLLGEIEKILSSTMFNVHFNQVSTIECMRCKSKVRRRLRLGKSKEVLEAKCYECQATYHVSEEEDGQMWLALASNCKCSTPDCGENKVLWQDELKPGTKWTCDKCNQPYELNLTVKKQAAPSKEEAAVSASSDYL